jgi:putative hydrolase of the HAD superfamily
LGIKAVTLDVGGTIAEGDLNTESYLADLLNYVRGIKRDVSTKEFRRATNSMLMELSRVRSENMEMEFNDLYSLFLNKLKIVPTKEVLEDVREIYFRNFQQIIVSGAREMLLELKPRYKLAVVSNTMSGAPKLFLIKNNLLELFDAVVLSCDIGIRKPDPKIFHRALEKLNVGPEEAIHVGDSLLYDVLGAKRAGMKTVWLKKEGGEDASVEPDLTIGSISELPEVIKAIDC